MEREPESNPRPPAAPVRPGAFAPIVIPAPLRHPTPWDLPPALPPLGDEICESSPAPLARPAPIRATKARPVARRHRRSLPFRLFRGVLILGLLAGGVTLAAIALARSQPAWWREFDPQDKAVIDAALRVENGAATQLTKIRKAELPSSPASSSSGSSDPWTIKLTSADANAWLAARLRPWLESQDGPTAGTPFTWPKELQRVEVEFDDGRIYVGARVAKAAQSVPISPDFVGPPNPYAVAAALPAEPSRTQIVTATLHPQFRSGSLWLPAQSVSLGRLALPASWMLPRPKPSATGADTAKALGPDVPEALAKMPQMRDLLAALSGNRPVMQSPIIKIGDGRRVRILSLDTKDGALYITCQTLARETTRVEK